MGTLTICLLILFRGEAVSGDDCQAVGVQDAAWALSWCSDNARACTITNVVNKKFGPTLYFTVDQYKLLAPFMPLKGRV